MAVSLAENQGAFHFRREDRTELKRFVAMSDSDFDLGQLEVDLTQLGGDEAEDLTDEVFAEEEQERFEDITNSFSKVSVTNWVKSGHQWETSDHQVRHFVTISSLRPVSYNLSGCLFAMRFNA